MIAENILGIINLPKIDMRKQDTKIRRRYFGR